jgi:hypothetical protein
VAPAIDEHALARRVAGDVAAVRGDAVLADVERAEHGGVRCAVLIAVVDRVDQHRDAEDVGQQDELLTRRIRLVSGTRQKIDRGHPLVERQVDVAHERVQVLDQSGQQRARARIGGVRKALDDRLGELGIVERGHRIVLVRGLAGAG